jgi:membrane-bound lytic murein transglycosylase B
MKSIYMKRNLQFYFCLIYHQKHVWFIMFPAMLSVMLLWSVRPGLAHQKDFASWLKTVHSEARQQGIRTQTLDTALSGLRPIPRVLELDRRQPEFTMTFTEYLQRVVTSARIQQGKRLFKTHQALLSKIGAAYKVQPRFIIALWGLETSYGRITGGFSVIGSLATLAYDGRRSAFFRRELLHALWILDQGHIQLEAMQGSWAGAMGQNQFMPSSFRQYAVDHNGDGRRDIWTTLPDVFASTANYLAQAGWRDDQTWGRQIRLPATFDPKLAGLDIRKSLPTWQTLGLRRLDGRDLPQQPLQASLLQPDGATGPAFLVYHNFRSILRWNRSNYFALAVGKLADAIRDP